MITGYGTLDLPRLGDGANEGHDGLEGAGSATRPGFDAGEKFYLNHP
jgi:hypothetical protein